MKIKDNNYYRNLYLRLLNAYDLKRNNHMQGELHNIYSRTYKKLLYNMFNRYENIEDFCFQFNSE